MKRMTKLTALAGLAALLLAGGLRAADEAANKADTNTGAAADAPKPDAEGFYPLFNGKDLTGWKVGKNPGTFKVQDGLIVVKGPGPSHLFYAGPVNNHDFKNFHLKLEVLTKPKANSGVYFHTKYQEEGWPSQGFEAQVNQTHSDPKKTGGLYAVKDVLNQSPAQDDKWYTYEIIVKGKHVEIKVDGKTTTDWTEPAQPKPPAGMAGRFLQHGTIALQGHDPQSEAHFKSILIKPLPE
jgi:hypothetical protein